MISAAYLRALSCGVGDDGDMNISPQTRNKKPGHRQGSTAAGRFPVRKGRNGQGLESRSRSLSAREMRACDGLGWGRFLKLRDDLVLQPQLLRLRDSFFAPLVDSLTVDAEGAG